ncbi:deoxyribose-phosphate aldolase [Candidatus Gracilibacteria bacterium]|nr:deoxyribose-phosphate aldolase [Candidatus Gracilibacteria bacterium]
MDELIARMQASIAQLIDLPTGHVLDKLPLPAPTPDTPLARYIDHTLLKPDATADQVRQLCAEAVSYGFASVCVNPQFVPLCAVELAGQAPLICTVIGFPLGANRTATKVAEAQLALAEGAHELDMVISIGALKAGDFRAVADDIAQVVATCHSGRGACKVIIETSLLNDEEKVAASVLAAQAGADFVKTSTGFSGGGATVADITLMRRTVGTAVGVKASGGVRTREGALAMIGAGATRIGASAGIAIVSGAAGTATY